MRNIAIIMTVFNRKEKTLACLDSVYEGLKKCPSLNAELWMTDDGSSDGSADAVTTRYLGQKINIIQGDGSLFWNGGMIAAWKAAIAHGGYDGYLWLNNDVVVLENLWDDLLGADEYSLKTFNRHGIYVGSLQDLDRSTFSYGGFNFTNKFTLRDEFVVPNGEYQLCECAHGNITYVSSEVVESQGIFCDKYIHGGTDHDYTYLAHKAGYPLIVLKEYAGLCDNDHKGSTPTMAGMTLKQRIKFLKSPHGLNLHNTLLFQRRCFPWRWPMVLVVSYAKAMFPELIYKIRMKIN